MLDDKYCKIKQVKDSGLQIEVVFENDDVVTVDKVDLFPDNEECRSVEWVNILISESGHRFSMQRPYDMFKDRVEFHWSLVRALTNDKFKRYLIGVGSNYLMSLDGSEEPMMHRK